jgi:hypothetical protein
LDLLSRKNENGEKRKKKFLHLDLESLARKIEKEFREEC